MISKLLETIAANPPVEVKALITLMGSALQEEQYRLLVNSELPSLPNFQQRKVLLESGHFSGMDLFQLLIACGAKNGVSLQVIKQLINQLIDWMLISDHQLLAANGYVQYMWNKPRIALFLKLKILDNVLLGPSYIAQKYRQSVPAIFVKKAQDEFTGTGFLVSDQSDRTKHVVITAKHNVDPADGIKFSGFGSPDGVTYRALRAEWILHPSLDLAAMPVECDETLVPIYPVGIARVLARTITLGYPRIATAAEPYLLAHGGELNAVVTSYHKESYLIISNLVAPGNSGGPVLDEAGLCVGMLVRALETEHEGGGK